MKKIQRICDFIVEQSFERGKYSLETLEEFASEINTINWTEYLAGYIQRQKDEEEKRLESFYPCPVCQVPEKIRILEKYDRCGTCFQSYWDRHARPCTFCQKPFLHHGGNKIYDVCYGKECQRAHQQVWGQNGRAKKAGLPATLTVEEWATNIRFFNQKCAYCKGTFQVLEHYLPIELNGGTTQANCMPSCNKCNGRKKDKTPEQFEHLFPAQNIQRIKEYQASLIESAKSA